MPNNISKLGGEGMKKSVAIILLLIFFLGGVAFGANSNSKEKSQVSAASTLTKQLEQYEQLLKDEEDEVFIPYDQLVSQTTANSTTEYVSAVAHNSVSQFGQDAGDMLKTMVREILRAIVKVCDQWITQ